MTVQTRILTIRLLESMKKNPSYSKHIKISDVSETCDEHPRGRKD